MSADDIAADFALFQVYHRVVDRLTPKICESLLFVIVYRPDSLEKVHRFQAVAILNDDIRQEAEATHHPRAAAVASRIGTLAQVSSEIVWGHLYGEAPMPPTDDSKVLVDFMNDAELMGILGLQAGWTPDLKQIDPDLDLKPTDKGLDL